MADVKNRSWSTAVAQLLEQVPSFDAWNFMALFSSFLYHLDTVEDGRFADLSNETWDACVWSCSGEQPQVRFLRDLRLHLDELCISDACGILRQLSASGQTMHSEVVAVFGEALSQTAQRQTKYFATPVCLAELMAGMMTSAKGDRILDPFCGSGILLSTCAEQWSSELVCGVDLNPAFAAVTWYNLYFRTGKAASVSCEDFLYYAQNHMGEFDAVISNPPYQSSLDDTLSYLSAILDVLRPGGRCGIFVPEGFLSSSAREVKSFRQNLLNQHTLTAVIALPPDLYSPSSGSYFSLMILEKGKAKKEPCVFLTRIPSHRGENKGQIALSPPYDSDIRQVVNAWKSHDPQNRYQKPSLSFWTVFPEEILHQEFCLFSADTYRPIPQFLLEAGSAAQELPQLSQAQKRLSALASNLMDQVKTPKPEVKWMRLDEVGEICSGTNLKSPKTSFGEGGCPWVMVEDLEHTVITKTARTLSKEGMREAKIVPANTVLFSSAGTIGKVGIAKEPVAPSNNVIAITFHQDQVYPLYGMYCLSALQADFEFEAQGAVYQSLRLSKFRAFRIPVPDMQWQVRAADHLEELQQLKKEQQTAQKEATLAIQKIFHRNFFQYIEPVIHGKATLVLESVAEVRLNGAPQSSDGERVPVRYVTTKNLDDHVVLWEEVVEAETNFAPRYQLIPGDIVMNRINQADHLGRCGLIQVLPQEQRAVFAQNTLRIRTNPQKILPNFLFAWLTHPYIKHYIQLCSKNSTSFQSSLNKQVILDLPIPQVDLTQQQVFSSLYLEYLEYCQTGRKILHLQEQLRQLWFHRIQQLLRDGQREEAQRVTVYQERRYWTAPSGTLCFYDSGLDCIQVPAQETRHLRLDQLPPNIDIQFLDRIRTASHPMYGALCHIRLRRAARTSWQIIQMIPQRYQPSQESAELLERTDLISEARDFGYLKQYVPLDRSGDTLVESVLKQYAPSKVQGYSRFQQLPSGTKRFIRQLSPFQQAVYEEFLLTMLPLPASMVWRQIMTRAGADDLSDGQQDVSSTIRLLEHAGLLEQCQEFYLDYYEEHPQGQQRHRILDQKGLPVSVNTWNWASPRR